ncbi:MAG: hypothetical protein ACT4OZ_08880 [Gemmatimonadota bacterium]
MFRELVGTGVRTGLLAAAATAGALVGLGLRHEAALQPFLNAGRAFLSTSSGLVPLAWLALIGGLMLHFAWMTAWGIAFTILSWRSSGRRKAITAVVLVTLLGLLVTMRTPSLLGVVGSAALTVPQLVFVLALMAIALLAGARLAPVSSR